MLLRMLLVLVGAGAGGLGCCVGDTLGSKVVVIAGCVGVGVTLGSGLVVGFCVRDAVSNSWGGVTGWELCLSGVGASGFSVEFGTALAKIAWSCCSCLRVSLSRGVWSLSSVVERRALQRSLAAATINPSRFAVGMRKRCGIHFRVSTMHVLLVSVDHTLWHR